MHPPAPIAMITGQGACAHGVSGVVLSLLTALGRWIEEVPRETDVAEYALVLVPDVPTWRAIRARYAGPIVVVDAGLALGQSAPPEVRTVGGRLVERIAIDGGMIVVPCGLPALDGAAVAGTPAGVAVQLDARTVYSLPVALSPGFRNPRGFWRLAEWLDRCVVALLGAAAGPFVEPWPDGARAARSITCDLDDLQSAAQLADLADSGRPGTLFACADGIPHLRGIAAPFEMAGHGDVHEQFSNDATNLSRVDAMCEAFAQAGWPLRGFSPPNLVWSSAIEPLATRFEHLRFGYQGPTWRIFPTRLGETIVTRISFYTDFLHRYVGHEETGRLIASADVWATETRGMSVPCFHPGLWTEPMRAYLRTPVPTAWEATLADITSWWRRRHVALARLARGEAVVEPGLRVVPEGIDARIAALLDGVTSRTGEAAGQGRSVRQVEVAKRPYTVVPAADESGVDVPLGRSWAWAGVMPSSWRRALLRVANRGGVTAGLYSALPLAPGLRGAAAQVPWRVRDEPLLLTPVRWRELGRPRRLGNEREVTIRA